MSRELDKVYEVYMDSSESAITRKTRERIQWIVTQTEGESVLDIGCSQGITSILLGRAGKRVLAIDLEETLVRFAKQKLSGEAQDVKENVTFAAGDFLSFPLGTRTFDTILMTEVLEHVPDVERFLKKAAACAQSHTKFVITVPFGIHDHWDHKRTYYVASLAEQMEADFQITSLNFMGGGRWLGITAVLKDQNVQAKGCVIVPDKERMLQEEQVFYQRERQLLDENARVKRQIGDQKGKNERLQEQNERLQEQNEKLKERTIFLKRRVEVLDHRWKTADTRLQTTKKNYADVSEKYQALSQSIPGRMQLFSWRVQRYIKRRLSLPEKKVLPVQEQKTETIRQEQKQTGRIPEFMNENVVMNDVYEFNWKERYLQLRENVCDVGYLGRVRQKINQMPDSNGSRYYEKLPYKIGMIADEFLYRSFADTAEFIYLTPDQYKYEIDVLLVASSWKGLHNEWKGLGNTDHTKLRDRLYEIIDYYKQSGTKVIFYSKEDPSNYYVFLEIAKKCDYIFTTAQECVEHYKKDTGNPQVYVLEFSVNPVQFHPVGMRMFHEEEVLFAGTWWNKKYPERKQDMETIFQQVLRAGKTLKIIDRNYSMGNADYFYPEKYLRYVSPEMDHATLQKVHKMHSFAININSIKHSSTMFASRVYELMALGNLIISNRSRGMEQKFPGVIVEDGSGQSIEILRNHSEKQIYEKRIAGIRRVMTKETTFDRMYTMMEQIGMPVKTKERTVGIILPDENEKLLREMAEAQTWPDKILIPKSSLNQQIYESCDIIAFFEQGSAYGKYYLEDMVNAFKYTDSDFITRHSYYRGDQKIDGTEHNYVETYEELGRTVFWRNSYELKELMEDNIKAEKRGYSVDCLNYKKIG